MDDLAVEFLGERPRAHGRAHRGRRAGPADGGRGGRGPGGRPHAAALAEPLARRLDEEGLTEIYRTMELPLVEVLADMERAGVKVNLAFLAGDEPRHGAADRRRSPAQIHELAGGPFNINSPIQLRDVLFDKLGMKSAKKTAKTRAASTAEEVLEELAAHHELPRKILEYRSVQKLKSTYVDALPLLVNPETGRIHGSFNQTVASTGRISMADPNLQNIPIRTAEGRRIREAFVAERGHLLLSADYSQIELRILAHLSKDATLIDTFRRGEDVHDRTVARGLRAAVAGARRTSSGASRRWSTTRCSTGRRRSRWPRTSGSRKKEAETFIEAYFARYPSVRAVHRRHHRAGAGDGDGAHAARPAAAAARPERAQLPGAHGGRAAGHEHAGAGLGGRPHQEGDDRPPPRAARARG